MKYVAVVTTGADTSFRPEGDFACFTGKKKDEVIARALRASRKWGPQYRVFVGRLTEEATTKTEYVLQKLEEK